MKLYQFTAIDEFGRLRYLEGFDECSTYSAAIFLQNQSGSLNSMVLMLNV
ncbi:MAG TPA: hypothetical protein GXZ53_09585 [Firmicutes bacterium]|jgi:hypothetical protein|nr:hypothetical protein [Bacillota bacterium]